ncbi:FAD-dependent oxidoreductase [Haladaptatus sp. NG-WS-4]
MNVGEADKKNVVELESRVSAPASLVGIVSDTSSSPVSDNETTMVDHDIAVIGGAVGCSVAKHLVERTDHDVRLIEKEYQLAEHQSGRNSSVLYPGFNYPPGSLKTRYSTEGMRRMKECFAEHDLPIDPLASSSSRPTTSMSSTSTA